MIKRRNWIKLIIVLLLSIAGAIMLFLFSVIDIVKIRDLGSDFQYNAISTSAIIGGFLFTGISILISAIDKDRIKRLWENNYLDNLYRAAFVGMISNVITIIAAITDICINVPEKIENILFCVETTGLIVGIVFFSWCIKKLISIISKLKSR